MPVLMKSLLLDAPAGDVPGLQERPDASRFHRHEFEAAGAKMLLTDRIECGLPGGSPANLLSGWVMAPGLRNMFAHCHRVTQRAVYARTAPV